MNTAKQRQRWIRTGCIVLVLFFLFYHPNFRESLFGPSGIATLGDKETTSLFPHPKYLPGVAKGPDEAYTRTLIIARTTEEDVSWIHDELSSDPTLSFAIYTVNETSPSGPYSVPINKGHEVMPYLTYIVDHYDNLTDVNIFMHAHIITWHNNDLLDSNAARMISSLSSPRVIREGYMNMRCHLMPGCPGNLHPQNPAQDDSLNYPETLIIGQAWSELFPGEPLPAILSQPCCAQFALSRDRIRALPRKQYIFFRDWLLNTELSDKLAGRVWEYVWQFVFAGVHEFCPMAHVCYCDGYGVCFGSRYEFDGYHKRLEDLGKMEEELRNLGETDASLESILELEAQIVAVRADAESQKREAFERGKDPKNRALEVGRSWKEGDGF